MGKPFKVVNNPTDFGDADHYGGVDIDNMANYLNDQSDAHTYTYFIYDDSGYKARNGSTGEVDFSDADDIGALLGAIFDSVSVTTPLLVRVAEGDFTLRSWDPTQFRHSNFTIKGSGSGVTRFIVHNDVFNIAGQTEVFAFEANATQYTSIALASNATVDAFAVLTNSTTDLVVGCHVMIGSNALIPAPNGVGKTGEHNRVVKIVATGGSPSQRIILEKNTRYAYNTADTAFIRRTDFLENIHLEGFTIMSNQDLTTNITFMPMIQCYDVHVKDLQFKDWAVWDSGTFHSNLVNTLVVNSDFDDLIFEQSPERGNSTGENPNGYAISCRSGCETVYYKNIKFKGLIRHCFTTTTNTASNIGYGEPNNIWVMNANSETAAEASFDTHGEGNNINFVNCSTASARSPSGSDSTAGSDDTDSFNSRSNYTRFINCTSTNNRGMGFSCDTGLTGVVFDGCYVKGITLGRGAISCGSSNAVIRNCHITDVDDEAIKVSGSNVQISNCHISNVCNDDNTKSPILIQSGAIDVNINGVLIDTSNGSTIVPIKTESGTENITLSNIHLVGAGTDCSFSGINIRWDHLSCTGRQLGAPRFKSGRFEGNANAGTGLWEGQITDTNGTKRIETTDGIFREYAVSVLNDIRGFRVATHTERDQNPYLRFKFRLEQTTGLRFFAGWTSDDTQLGPSGSDPLANNSGIGAWLDTGTSSNIVIYSNSGDASTTKGATLQAVNTNAHVFEMRGDTGSAFQYRWDYGTWVTLSTDIPAATTDLGLQFYIQNIDSGVTKTLNMLGTHVDIPNL